MTTRRPKAPAPGGRVDAPQDLVPAADPAVRVEGNTELAATFGHRNRIPTPDDHPDRQEGGTRTPHTPMPPLPRRGGRLLGPLGTPARDASRADPRDAAFDHAQLALLDDEHGRFGSAAHRRAGGRRLGA